MRASVLLAVGETMALVTPTVSESLLEAGTFHVDAGGAESNVAAHVVALGHPARWFSRLGADPLGERIARRLRGRGIDLAAVEFDPRHPTGVYFKDPGRGVHYYRASSAASHLSPADVNALPWDDVRVLHVSGITAAISDSAAAFLDRAVDDARERSVLVSFDVNHRAALWDAADAGPALAALARRADVVFVGRDEAETLWGTRSAADARAFFPEVPEFVVKDGDVGATTFAGGEETFVPALTVEVVEPVGAGDAFAGGYLAGLLSGIPVPERLALGHTRAALVLGTTDDFTNGKVKA